MICGGQAALTPDHPSTVKNTPPSNAILVRIACKTMQLNNLWRSVHNPSKCSGPDELLNWIASAAGGVFAYATKSAKLA
jgi:hypothetical protein